MAGQANIYHLVLDVPESVARPDFYELLRLERFEDDVPTIRAAAADQNSKLLKWQSSEFYDEIERLFDQLADAREVLLDPLQKTEYDARLGRPGAAEAVLPGSDHASSAELEEWLDVCRSLDNPRLGSDRASSAEPPAADPSNAASAGRTPAGRLAQTAADVRARIGGIARPLWHGLQTLPRRARARSAVVISGLKRASTIEITEAELDKKIRRVAISGLKRASTVVISGLIRSSTVVISGLKRASTVVIPGFRRISTVGKEKLREVAPQLSRYAIPIGALSGACLGVLLHAALSLDAILRMGLSDAASGGFRAFWSGGLFGALLGFGVDACLRGVRRFRGDTLLADSGYLSPPAFVAAACGAFFGLLGKPHALWLIVFGPVSFVIAHYVSMRYLQKCPVAGVRRRSYRLSAGQLEKAEDQIAELTAVAGCGVLIAIGVGSLLWSRETGGLLSLTAGIAGSSLSGALQLYLVALPAAGGLGAAAARLWMGSEPVDLSQPVGFRELLSYERSLCAGVAVGIGLTMRWSESAMWVQIVAVLVMGFAIGRFVAPQFVLKPIHPEDDEQPAESEIEDTAFPGPPPPEKAVCANCGFVTAAGTAVCLNCGSTIGKGQATRVRAPAIDLKCPVCAGGRRIGELLCKTCTFEMRGKRNLLPHLTEKSRVCPYCATQVLPKASYCDDCRHRMNHRGLIALIQPECTRCGRYMAHGTIVCSDCAHDHAM